MPIWGDLCSLLSALCSPTSVSCTSIGRFANRPYHRTQKFSCLYEATSVHCSLLSAHWPLSHAQHRAICKSPLPQDAKILMPIWGNLCSLLSALCSPTSVSCTSIGRFANRPYHRTQKFSCLYEATSVLCSLLSVHRPLSHAQHRAICKSPLPQNAKNLMRIWGNLCSLLSALCSPTTVHCSLTSYQQNEKL